MSPFREALIAYGFGEWALVDGELVRVAREYPLQLAETVHNRERMKKTARTSGTKRTTAKSRTTPRKPAARKS